MLAHGTGSCTGWSLFAHVAHEDVLTVIGGCSWPADRQGRQHLSSCEQLQIGAGEWSEMAPLSAAPDADAEPDMPTDVIRGCACTLQDQLPSQGPESAEREDDPEG